MECTYEGRMWPMGPKKQSEMGNKRRGTDKMLSYEGVRFALLFWSLSGRNNSVNVLSLWVSEC